MRVDEIAGRYEADLAGREVARRGLRAGCGWQRVDVVGHRGETINSQQVGEASEPLGYDAGGAEVYQGYLNGNRAGDGVRS